MANQSGNQTRINLTDGLILNKNKCEVTQFTGFKERNSPYYNGGVAPMYETEKTGEVIDKGGNTYSLVYANNNLGLVKNGSEYISLMPDEELGYHTHDRLTSISKEIVNNDLAKQWMNETGFTVSRIGFWKIRIAISGIFLDCCTPNGNNSYSILLDNDSFFLGESYKFFVKVHSPDVYSGDIETEYVTVVAVTDNASNNGARYYIVKDRALIHSVTGATDETNTSLSLAVLASGDTDHKTFQFHWQNKSSNGLTTMADTDSYIYSEEADGGMFFSFSSTIASDSPLIYGADDNLGAWEITGDNEKHIYKLTFGYNGSYVSYVNFPVNTVPYDATMVFNNDYKYFVKDGLSYITGTYTKSDNIISFLIYDLDGKFHIGSGINEDGSVPINCKVNAIEDEYGNTEVNYLYNNSNLSGISHQGVLLTPWLDVDTGVLFPFCDNYRNEKYEVYYFSKSLQEFIKITVKYFSSVDELSLRLINDRYIVINKGGYNCYDLKLNKLTQYAPDWNNRVFLGSNRIDWYEEPYIVNRNPGLGSGIIGSGISSDYENDNNITSALFNPTPLQNTIRVPCPLFEVVYMPVDVYIGEAEGEASYFTTVQYKISFYAGLFQGMFIFNKTKEGTTYPVTTDGNILLSPSIFAGYYETKLLSDYIKENGIYYNLVYTEGEVVLLYPYGTGVKNAQESFVIQGQRYVIRNSVICSATISDGLLTVGEGIVNVGSLQFIGCLPSAAHFYSPATECLMAFTGDRLLSTVFEATEIEEIVCSDYSPNSNALYIASADAVYSLFSTPDGNSFIYKIERAGVTAIKILNDGTVAFQVDDYFYIYSIYPRSGYDKIPVELSTEFYGYGENRVSVIDSWYIRLYSEEAEEGTLILKVESITDGSTESETKTVRINKTDWDSNGFFYFRYQPQIQRGVGVSLAIKSDFTIYDLQASYSPDSTLQLTAKANTSNNANTF